MGPGWPGLLGRREQQPGQGGPYPAAPEQSGPYAGWSGPNPGPTGQHNPYSTPQPGPFAGGPQGYGQYSAPPGYQATQPGGYPGWTPAAATPGTGNGRAVAGLILGILSLALFFFNVLDVPLVVLGIIFSSLGLAAAKRGEGRRAMALAGLICSLIAVLVVAATTVFVLHRMRICDRSYDRGTSQYNSCIVDFG